VTSSAPTCPFVEGTPVALFMEQIHYLAIIYVQLSGGRACYVLELVMLLWKESVWIRSAFARA